MGSTPLALRRPLEVEAWLSQEDKGRLMEVMIYNLAKSGDHYVSFDSASKIQSFGPNVTKVSLWWEFCQAYDPEFVAQSHRLGYRHGRDRKELCPSPEKFAEDEAGKQIFPRVGLRTASNFFALHKVRFGKLRVDVCEECERFRFELLTAQGDKRKRLLEALRKHLEEADLSYAFRKADHDRARYSATFSCADCDFAGGFRTPWINIAIAYYSRIIPMTNYMICGPDFVDMYGYDESVAGKGPDEVCSFIYDWLVAEKKRKPALEHVTLWCDSCGGQTWNQYVIRLIHEVVNPLSDLYIEGLRCIDLKKATKGHSYLWCDRAIVPIKAKARRIDGGIVCAFDEEELPEEFKHRTWQKCIEDSKINGNAYRLHRVTQEMVKAFKEFWGRQESVLIKAKSYDRSINLTGRGTSAQKLNYCDDSWNISGEFLVRDISWITAGSINLKTAGRKGEGSINHNGELWCRKDFENESQWFRLPIFRPSKKDVEGVTVENYETEKSKHGKLNQLYQAPLLLSVLKVENLHTLGQAIANGNGLECIYPPADPKALAEAKGLQEKKRKENKERALGTSQSSSSSSSSSSDQVMTDVTREAVEARKKQKLLVGMAALGKGGSSD